MSKEELLDSYKRGYQIGVSNMKSKISTDGCGYARYKIDKENEKKAIAFLSHPDPIFCKGYEQAITDVLEDNYEHGKV